jgi:hypothetical protein
MMNEAHQCIYVIIAMVLIMTAFLTSRTAEARTYYVATSGDEG